MNGWSKSRRSKKSSRRSYVIALAFAANFVALCCASFVAADSRSLLYELLFGAAAIPNAVLAFEFFFRAREADKEFYGV